MCSMAQAAVAREPTWRMVPWASTESLALSVPPQLVRRAAQLRHGFGSCSGATMPKAPLAGASNMH
jgi:hypothetical protein